MHSVAKRFVILVFVSGAWAATPPAAMGLGCCDLPSAIDLQLSPQPACPLYALNSLSGDTPVLEFSERSMSRLYLNVNSGVDRSYQGAPITRKGRWSKRLIFSAGVTVATAVVARWSKEEADRSYDRYMSAANTETQRKQFDRTERYDRISGLALASMEAGVLLTTYLVFF